MHTYIDIYTMKISLWVLFIFFFTFQPCIVTSEPRYKPIENVALDCGSQRDQPVHDKRIWVRDDNKDDRFALIEEESNGKSTSLRALSQGSSVETVPYMTARISRSKFTYSFRVSVPGPKFVRLHFYPAPYEQDFNVSGSFFAVTAGPYTLLKNFSASLFAEYEDRQAFAKEFCINVKENKTTIDLTFTPASSSYAFVNGIEVVSMPKTLYYAPADDPSKSPSFIRQKGNSPFGSYSDRALETLYRLNVGGRAISPMDDTGMYRQWSEARSYFHGEAVTPFNTNLPLKYTKIPNYTAPDEVYQTASTMGRDAAKNRARNLTWCLPVDRRFFYLVRLHFCQFQKKITTSLDMVFYVYIDNRTAEEYANIVSWTGGDGNGIPVYRDYVVYIRDEDNLFIAVHPNGDQSYYEDAILNGIEVFKMSNEEKNLAGPNPSNASPPGNDRGEPSPPGEKSGSKKMTVLIVALGVSSGFAVLCVVFCVVLRKKKKTSKRRSSMRSSKGSSLLPEDLCRHFYLWEIRSATRDFDNELMIGRGGFGNVYKGFIDGDESKPVAVKRLNPGSGQGSKEFITEIEMLSMLRHVHLVSLVGYCDEDGEMILVYDYVANGTLRDHLYGPNHEPLPWKTRLKVCVGAARGLHYLHVCVKGTIIHRDVKTTNILLDENWVAKVSDFGLSKTGPTGGPVSTLVKGTFGYLDPEYMQREKLSDKSDVYSFGVVLFEVLCGRKPVDPKLDEAQRNLADWARKCARDGTIHEIIDPFLMGKIAPACFKKFVEVAESCLRDTWSQRPSMGDVTEKLEFALELQEQADAVAAASEQENIPGRAGGVYYYPQVSFHLADDHDHDRRAGFDLLGLRGGTGLTTTVGSGSTSGVSFISLETESRTNMFSETTVNSESKV